MKLLPLDETLKDIDVYVILSESSNEFYVGKNKSGNCRQTYKDSVAGKYKQTKDLFARARSDGNYPKMYLLETLQVTDETAFRYCVAWIKFFLNCGYNPLNQEVMLAYSADLLDETQRIFDTFAAIPVSQILSDERLIVSNYKRKERPETPQKEAPKNFIGIHLSKKDYAKILQKAEQNGMSMSRYCKNMVLSGRVVKLDPPPIEKHTAVLDEAKELLRQLLYAYYQNGKYYPADLENIQKSVDKIIEAEAEMTDAFLRYAAEVTKKLPK